MYVNIYTYIDLYTMYKIGKHFFLNWSIPEKFVAEINQNDNFMLCSYLLKSIYPSPSCTWYVQARIFSIIIISEGYLM